MFETTPLIEHFPYLGLFSLLLLGTLGLPFPEDSVLLLSGFLAARHHIEPLQAFLVVYPGLLITDFLLYSAGKQCGRRIIEHRKFRKVITHDRLAKLENKFRKWGVLFVFFGRHVLGLRAQIFLAAGVFNMDWKKFLLADGASAFITIALWGGLGYAGGNYMDAWRRDITSMEFILMVFFATLVGSVLFLRYRKKKRNAMNLGEESG